MAAATNFASESETPLLHPGKHPTKAASMMRQ
jgi:hypothetical protein